MKLILALSLLGIAFNSRAQPVLTSDVMDPIGSTWYMRFIYHFSAVDTSIQGADVTWDFTGLSIDLDQPQFIATIVDPAPTPYPNLSTIDNYAWWEQPNNYYRYFEKTPTYLQRVGAYTSYSYVFADPQKELVFPLTYGTTNTDSWVGQSDAGTYKINCIGYGTLMIPGHTYNDVLMLRNRITGYTYSVDTYFWYDSSNGRILVQYINNYVSNIGLFVDSYAIGIQETEAFKATILENPVRDQAVVVMGQQSAMVNYTIIGTSGRMVAQGRMNGNIGAVQYIDATCLTPGLYTLELSDRDHPSKRIRFIKI